MAYEFLPANAGSSILMTGPQALVMNTANWIPFCMSGRTHAEIDALGDFIVVSTGRQGGGQPNHLASSRFGAQLFGPCLVLSNSRR